MKDGQKKVHRCIELRIEANALMITIFGFLVDSSFFFFFLLKDDEFSFHMYTHLQNERLSTNRRKERKRKCSIFVCVNVCVHVLRRRQIHQQFLFLLGRSSTRVHWVVLYWDYWVYWDKKREMEINDATMQNVLVWRIWTERVEHLVRFLFQSEI